MDDLISRQAALKIIEDYKVEEYGANKYLYDLIYELPSAERHGKWDMMPDPYGFFDEIPVCSECGCTTKMRETYRYCPNCGAKMEMEGK